MKINQNEIASVQILGTLDGHDIKLIKTRGGLNLAIGPDGKGGETVMGAGSHQAIVLYNFEKNHPSFHPAIMKSDNFQSSIAEKHSHFLSDDLRKSGHDIYSVEEGNEISFFITKHDLKLGSIVGFKAGDTLKVSSYDPKLSSFREPLSYAVSEKTLGCGLKKVKIG